MNKKYGAYVSDIKAMMAIKLTEFVKKQLADLSFEDSGDVLVSMAMINGASNIVDEIIEELSADEEES